MVEPGESDPAAHRVGSAQLSSLESGSMLETLAALLAAVLLAIAGGPLGNLGNRIVQGAAARLRRDRGRPEVDALLPANMNRLVQGSYAQATAVRPAFDIDMVVISTPEDDHLT